MPVTRLFANATHANEAATELRAAGYRKDLVHVISGSTTPAKLTHHGVDPDHAWHLAKRIESGATLVIVEAPFGYARRATQILESERAGEAVPEQTTYKGSGLDNAAPFSAFMGWSVLSKNPTPFSSFWGLRVLSRRQTPRVSLSHNPTPLSSSVGMGTLSGKAAPLSGMIGLKPLSHNPAPFSSMLGLKVVTQGSKTTTGVGKLSHHPAPLSSLLGLPVLLHED